VQNAVRIFFLIFAPRQSPTHEVNYNSHVPVRYRDNLEFLQWMKRYWDTNYPGHPYDPVARRRGQSTDTPSSLAPLATRSTVNTPGVAGSRSGGKTPVGGHRTGSASAMNHEQVLGLQTQLKEMSAHLEGLEKERDFYFAKVLFCFFLSFLFQGVLKKLFIAARYRDPSATTNGRARQGGSRRRDPGRDSKDSILYRGGSLSSRLTNSWTHRTPGGL
jgi:hypothetical protein